VFRRRRASIAGESLSDPRSLVNSPRLRAAELYSVRFIIFRPSLSLYRVARKEEGRRTPARSIGLRRVHRPGGVTPVGARDRPHSQNQ
jgi:hypothetical protein